MSVRARAWQTGAALLGTVAFLVTVPGVASVSAAPTQSDFAGTATASGAAIINSIPVGDAAVPITASLDWTDPAANINLYLVDPSGATVVTVASSAKPKTFAYTPAVTGTYKLRVKGNKGSSAFTLHATYSDASGTATGPAAYSKTYGFADTKSIFPYGMAWDPTDGTVLVGDYWNFRVQRFNAQGAKIATYRNAALATGVGAPYDIATDPTDIPASGLANYWVADQEQGVVVEFDHAGNVLHQLGVGGTGSYFHARGCGNGAMTNPTHLTIDPVTSNLFISDVVCKNVYVYAHDGTYLHTFDWSGWKTATGFFTPTPRGIQIDENGTVYVLELNSRTVVVFNSAGVFQRTFGVISDMNDPRGLDIDTTRHVLYAIGALHQRVFKFDYNGNLLKKWDSPTGSNAINADEKFNSIRTPAVDPATGNVYLGDSWAYRVYKFDSNGVPAPAALWSSTPSPPADGGYTQQTGVAVDPTGTLFVTGSFDQRVQAFDTTKDCRSEGASTCSAFLRQWGTRVNSAPNASGFDYPKAMVFTDGYLWVGENDGNDIHAYRPDGTWVHRFGLQGPAVGQFKGGVQGLYVDPHNANNNNNGLVFATDVGNCRLQVFDENFLLNNTSGAPISAMGGCGTGTSQMSAPRGVVADGSTAYVIETGGGRISVWNWVTGVKTTSYRPSCGGSIMSGPWDAAWDPTHTWIYIGDKGRARVVRWDPNNPTVCQVVTTGSDTPEGALSGPDFLNFGPDGKLYVSDNNKRVYSFTITG